MATEGYGSVIENGACVSEGDRLSYHNIVNNNPTEGSEGIEMDCANYCSSYSGVDGYVGFSLRFSGTVNLVSYPIGRCQCQFKQGTVRPEDTSDSTSVWWGSSASSHVDLAMGNGNSNYVCYPWSDAVSVFKKLFWALCVVDELCRCTCILLILVATSSFIQYINLIASTLYKILGWFCW